MPPGPLGRPLARLQARPLARTFLVLLLALVGDAGPWSGIRTAAAQPTASPAVSPAVLGDLDAYVARVLEEFKVPGLSLAVVQDDRILLAKGYGVRRLGEPARVDEDTLFAIGSISKSFTALALGLLCDEGKLHWDDRVTTYLPDFQLYDPYVTREFTVRDLLTHRSGLEAFSGGTLWYGSNYSREEVLRRIHHLKPVASFRSTFAYQNVLYLAAGQILPAVSGKSWDDFVTERLLRPLGMARSFTRAADLARASNVAAAHVELEGRVRVVPWRSYDNIAPAGSIMSSAKEMAEYLRLQLSRGQVGGRRLVSEAVMDETWEPQTILPRRTPPPEFKALQPEFSAYGLGWFVEYREGAKVVTHSGGVDGMTALVTLLPGRNLGIVVLSNQQGPETSLVTRRIFETLAGGPVKDWDQVVLKREKVGQQARQAAEQKLLSERARNTRPSLPLAAYAGRYRDEMYGDVLVAVEGARLVARFSHSPTFIGELEHWHYDTFRVRWRDPLIAQGMITFVLDDHGRIDDLRLVEPPILDIDFSELHLRRVVEEKHP